MIELIIFCIIGVGVVFFLLPYLYTKYIDNDPE